MLLKKIIINNFGLFKGPNEFALETAPSKSIVLCGGKNGAGKTTLFESIMLCLYGKNASPYGVSKKQYLAKISKSFHRLHDTRQSADEASITVEFQYAHDGHVFEYQVMRMWTNYDGKVDEQFAVRKMQGGEFVRLDSEESSWQSFIDQLLPKGIANLFFFDGEKIKSIADSGGENQHIRSSFDTLLGLDLVKQLHDDIGLYMLRSSDDKYQAVADEIERMTQEKQTATRKIDEYGEKIACLNADIANLQSGLEVHEAKFSQIGGVFAKRREALTIKKAKLESKIEEIQRQLRHACSDILPLAMIPQELSELKEEIRSDLQKTQSGFEKEILEKNFASILEDMKTDQSFHGDGQAVIRQLKEIFDKKLESLTNAGGTLFNFSANDMSDYIQLIDAVNESGASEMESLSREYNELLAELKTVSESLDMSPKQDEAGPLFSEITHIGKEIGELEHEKGHLENLVAQEKSLIVLLNSRIRKNLSKRTEEKRRQLGREMSSKVQDVLKEYSGILKERKIQMLEQSILGSIKKLFHKNDFIENISIDKDTFDVSLYKKNGDEITKDMLSSGELQMYATAIIWGLAKTSERPLPFVIDTPLARLDTDHRDSLVDDFFPAASHQTIILSTDSEITQSYYKRLKPYISKSMMIEYDSKQGRTTACDRYFFDGGETP